MNKPFASLALASALILTGCSAGDDDATAAAPNAPFGSNQTDLPNNSKPRWERPSNDGATAEQIEMATNIEHLLNEVLSVDKQPIIDLAMPYWKDGVSAYMIGRDVKAMIDAPGFADSAELLYIALWGILNRDPVGTTTAYVDPNQIGVAELGTLSLLDGEGVTLLINGQPSGWEPPLTPEFRMSNPEYGIEILYTYAGPREEDMYDTLQQPFISEYRH